MAAGLSHSPADGGAIHRLADPRQPAGALPRDREEQQLAPPPRRRPQPAATARHGPHPRARNLAAGPRAPLPGLENPAHTKPPWVPGGRNDPVVALTSDDPTCRMTASAAFRPPPTTQLPQMPALFSMLLGIVREVAGAVSGAEEPLVVGVGPQVDPWFDGGVAPAGVGLEPVVMSAERGEVARAGRAASVEGHSVVAVAAAGGACAVGEDAVPVAQLDVLTVPGPGR